MAGGLEAAVAAGALVAAIGVGVELAVVVGDAEVEIVPFVFVKRFGVSKGEVITESLEELCNFCFILSWTGREYLLTGPLVLKDGEIVVEAVHCKLLISTESRGYEQT